MDYIADLLSTPPILAPPARRALWSAWRGGRVMRKPGFDGEYGVIRVFEEGEKLSA